MEMALALSHLKLAEFRSMTHQKFLTLRKNSNFHTRKLSDVDPVQLGLDDMLDDDFFSNSTFDRIINYEDSTCAIDRLKIRSRKSSNAGHTKKIFETTKGIETHLASD